MAARLTTTQRGLGYSHQQRARTAKAAMADGDPCSQCGQPMYKGQRLELDHLIPRALGGVNGPVALAHEFCNRSAGGRLGNRMRPRQSRRRYTRW